MEGFLRLRLPAWCAASSRARVTLVPALFIIGLYGSGAATGLLMFSQVVRSLQLPFAVIPLVRFTSTTKVMGEARSPLWLIAACMVIPAVLVGLNIKFVSDVML
jgi:manganese transport protein